MGLFHPFRDHRRKALAERPFPAEWSAIIAKNVPYVRTLHPDERKRLEALIQIFIAEKNFEGCGGLEVTDEMRVTVAAQACLLLLNLHDSYYGMIAPFAWDPGENGPWSHLAVAPAAAPLTPYCLPGDLPGDGHTGYTDGYQIWSSLAYAYEMTGNPLFVTGLQRLIGTSDVKGGLEASGDSNIFNRAAALAMAQQEL